MKYMRTPQKQVTIGGTVYEAISFDVTRIENGVDSANVWLSDRRSINYPTNFTAPKTVKIEVKDASESAWTTMFNGKSIYALPILSMDGEIIQLKCAGNAYGLTKMLAAYEYGSDALGTGYDTIAEIIGAGDATNGILHKWVNHLKGDTAVASGYAYTSTLEAIAGTINYMNFPYKPANKCIDDLCDLVTAIKAGGAGPHWFVNTSDALYVQLLTSTTAGWTLYYLDSAANATLTQDVDFKEYSFEKMDKEANYIVYAGDWRRPSTGDAWSENTSSLWTETAGTFADTAGAEPYKVGSYALKLTSDVTNFATAYYPAAQNMALDATLFKEDDIPHLSFYWRQEEDSVTGIYIAMCKDATHYYDVDFYDASQVADQWYKFNVPFGDYWRNEKTDWKWVSEALGGDWSAINYIEISAAMLSGEICYIDGFNMNGRIIRIASQTAGYSAADPCLMKLITDDVGKDDTLTSGTPGTTDTGVMARMAYAEYLRCNSTPIVGDISVPMLPDLLPGQRLHIHAKPNAGGTYQIDADMRAYEMVHVATQNGFFTNLKLTNDLTNTHTRRRHSDLNKIYGDMRPEFQDRQASNLKLGALMYDVPTFIETY